jgi:hypothetical protein
VLAVEVSRFSGESDAEPEVVVTAADREAPVMVDEGIGDVNAEPGIDFVDLLVP